MWKHYIISSKESAHTLSAYISQSDRLYETEGGKRDIQRDMEVLY